MSNRVLVTGAGGFVGRHVVQLLRGRGDDVIEVVHRWRNLAELTAIVGDGQIDRAIHLAWSTGARYRTDVSANFASFQSGLEVVQLLADRACRQLVVAGTGAEYRPVDRVVSENDIVEPVDAYSAMKAALGRVLVGPGTTVPFPVAWTRLFSPNGPGDHATRLVPSVAQAVLRGEQLAITDGYQQVEVLDVSDVAAAMVRLADHGESGVWNVSSGETLELRALLERLADRLGDRALLRFGAREPDPWARGWYVGDSSRLRADTGWAPACDEDAVLDRVSRYWRDQLHRPGSRDTS